MVHYKLATENQKELANLAYSIVKDKLGPQLAELEKTESFPQDVREALNAAGFANVGIPAEYGGLGLGVVDRCLIYEEMGKIDAAFAFAYHGDSTRHLINSNLPEDQKQYWLKRQLAGESYGCFGVTEPSAGSDIFALRTTAVKDGDEWVINGTKCFASQAAIADWGCFLAWTDKSLGSKGLTAFFIERERGWQVTKVEEKMGFRLSPTCDVVLDNIRVPDDHIVGKVGEGLKHAMSSITEARITTMSCAIGMAQAALDYAVQYAKERRQKGKRIIDFQGVGFMIADMQTKIDAARALLYYTAEVIDRGLSPDTLGSETKNFVAKVVMDVTIDAVQVLGGYGLMKDYPVEKYMRDAKVFSIFEGTTQINQQTIAKAIAGKDPQEQK